MTIAFTKRLARRLSPLLAAVVLAVSLSAPALPTAAATAEEQIDQLEREKADLQKRIAAAQDALNGSKQKRDLYNSQINNVTRQISILDDEMASVNRQIAAKNTSIAAMEREITVTRAHEQEVRDTLGQRLNAMARRGNFSTLQLLLNTENYTDYLIRSKVMEKIAAADQAAIDELEKTVADIKKKEQRLQQEKQDVEQQKARIGKLRASSTSKKGELEQLYGKANAAYRVDKAERDALNRELEKTNADITRLLRSIKSSGSYDGSIMFWPVPTVRAISSGFKWRWGKMHRGIDIANGPIPIYGENIVAAADGVVVYANYTNEYGGGYGYYCMVDHGLDKKGRQIVTLYAHCSRMFARVGQKVTGGKTVLAKAGKSGNVTGPHLHFEVRVNGVAVDPLKGYVSVNGK